MGHIEYKIANHFDIIGKDAKDFPFEEYADFFIDCSNEKFAIAVQFQLCNMFWDDDNGFDCEIMLIGVSSPYLVYRVTKK